ncbi:hypothetical protein [Vibrio mediterranei]|uniref:hypothetical protein n=1 Tax=Vibrio mediterranei TaxID=689 RepID=UPI0022848FB7|nr:hypothetical protein [Vibrio mediterranei]MCY9855391.1 hypothetical protein [Vibrio mediterranei]
MDAENIEITALSALVHDPLDHVFVFSLSFDVESVCHRHRWHYLNDYVVGNNQADFALIAEFVKQLTLAGDIANKHDWRLHSKDNALRQAFTSVGQAIGVAVKLSPDTLITAKTTAKAIEVKPKAATPEEQRLARFLAALPAKLDDALRTQLRLSKPSFTRLINQSINEGRIERDGQQRSLWRKKEKT